MASDTKVLAVQKFLRGAGYDPGPLDGIIGPLTLRAMERYINREIPPPQRSVVELYFRYCDALSERAILIELLPIKLRYWQNNEERVFWLHKDVRDSFRDAIAAWESAGGHFRVTETLRTVEQQERLHEKKPHLAAKPGWSLHAHGRAVDFSTRAVGEENLVRFYAHMQRYGWYTIFNFPGRPIHLQAHEAWHLQKTEPPGIRARDYLSRWAREKGAVTPEQQTRILRALKYKRTGG